MTIKCFKRYQSMLMAVLGAHIVLIKR